MRVSINAERALMNNVLLTFRDAGSGYVREVGKAVTSVGT